MSEIKEYIGCKSIEAVNYDGHGDTLYNQWLTNQEIIRCRDCDRSEQKGWKCNYWVYGRWNEELEADEITLADVRPDGFCFKAERREACYDEAK